MKRRKFLNTASVGTGGLLLTQPILSFTPGLRLNKDDKLTFGIVADVHHGMIPDTEDRLEQFIAEATTRKVDFILQLGDFCHAEEKSKAFLKIWQSFLGNKYHVLGNHDMDLNSKQAAMDLWGMASNYYTFDEKGVRFVVLDANYLYQDGQYIPYDKGNFYVDNSLRTYIDEEQIEWFGAALGEPDLPVIVISHQSLWHYQSGVKNRLSLQQLMERHAEKIICCFNGHNHIDFHHYQNGINYVEVNSMSYQWLGDRYKTSRYPATLLKDYKWLDHLAPYQDPLYAFVEIDPKGVLRMSGRKSQWMSPSPEAVGVPKKPYGNESTPVISDHTLTF